MKLQTRGEYDYRSKILKFWLVCIFAMTGSLLLSRTSAGAVGFSFSGNDRVQSTKEISDPCLNLHWRLVVDSVHPEWPGRLVLLNGNDRQFEVHQPPSGEGYRAKPLTVVIRAGDRILVHQDSGSVQGRFAAVALESAGVGQKLRVRLIFVDAHKLGGNQELALPGKEISAIAISAGEARWSQ